MIPESLSMTFPVLEENVLSLQNWGMLPSRQGPPPMPLSVIKRVRFPGGGEVSGSEGDSSFLPSALTGVLSMPDFGFPERTLGGSLQLGRLKRGGTHGGSTLRCPPRSLRPLESGRFACTDL